MTIFTKRIIFILFIVLSLSDKCFTQVFLPGQSVPLITIPGDNRNFSLTSPTMGYFWRRHESYICWENKLGIQYSIYLKRIDPQSNDIITVWSDSKPSINPAISCILSDSSIKVVWQTLVNNRWHLYSRIFRNDELSDVEILTDTLHNSISPSLNETALAWIENGRLLYKTRFDSTVVDSISCSNPVLIPYYGVTPMILYEKDNSLNKQVWLAAYMGQYREQKPYWKITRLSDSSINNINPSFASLQGISYQARTGNYWQGVFQQGYNMDLNFNLTGTRSYNIEHPILFNIPRLSGIEGFPSYSDFLVFDSDLLESNREIFIGYNTSKRDTVINISTAQGDDSKPAVAFLNSAGINTKYCLIWEHQENNKTDIWWASAPLKLPQGDVKDKEYANHSYTLKQNYPNPFNPITTISYFLPERSFVTLKIFNILGQEITTLVNNEHIPGEHRVQFDASDLNSGFYLYTIQAGSFRDSKKLLLLK